MWYSGRSCSTVQVSHCSGMPSVAGHTSYSPVDGNTSLAMICGPPGFDGVPVTLSGDGEPSRRSADAKLVLVHHSVVRRIGPFTDRWVPTRWNTKSALIDKQVAPSCYPLPYYSSKATGLTILQRSSMSRESLLPGCAPEYDSTGRSTPRYDSGVIID